jgi:hypothetical protein
VDDRRGSISNDSRSNLRFGSVTEGCCRRSRTTLSQVAGSSRTRVVVTNGVESRVNCKSESTMASVAREFVGRDTDRVLIDRVDKSTVVVIVDDDGSGQKGPMVGVSQ